MVQGVLAPLQFVAFIASTGLVLHYLISGHGYEAATLSVVVKTGFLYAIMITGSLWEKAVFGRYLLAPAFFWEDMFSFLVIALHTAYLLALVTGALTSQQMMMLALTAFSAYVVNAAQFVIKLRAVRREAPIAGMAVAK
jgi:3-vinyl bacteriochlorophyllide hydratase